MKLQRFFLMFAALLLVTPFLFSADPVTAAGPAPALVAIPKPWNPTNTLNQLPSMDRIWLMGEQMKQLVGDWVNQQGDIGVDLLYYIQEPVRILTEEMKRMERDHQKDITSLQKDITSLRAEINALKQTRDARPTR